MRARFQRDTASIFQATIAAVGVGVAIFLLLQTMARPSHFSGRLAEVNRQIDVSQRLAFAPGDAAAYPRGAMCGGDAASAAASLRQRVELAAGRAGLAKPAIQANPRSIDAVSGGPVVDLEVRADGRYDAVVNMLRALAAERPQIFVDTLDLQPHVSAVALKLSGHLYCRRTA